MNLDKEKVIIIEPKLEQLLKDFFSRREREEIRKYIKSSGVVFDRSPNSSNYKVLLRALKKLRNARDIMAYEQVEVIMKDHRGRKRNA